MADFPDSSASNSHIRVGGTEETRAEFIANASPDPEFRARLSEADVLLVPLPGHGDYRASVFPQGTLEIFQFLKAELPEGVAADIAIEDGAYEELTLHAAEIVLPTLLFGSAAGSIVLNVISNYLYDLLKDSKARRESRVRARLLVETEGRTVSLDYDGPADQFAATAREALQGGVQHVDPQLTPSASQTGELAPTSSRPMTALPANISSDNTGDTSVKRGLERGEDIRGE